MGKFIPLVFLSFGIFVLLQVILPVIKFKIWEVNNIKEENILVSPQIPESQILGVSIQNTEDNFPAIVSFAKRDFTPYREFSISIPDLKIEGARVFVDSNDLSIGLAHLPGSALPGERGNIFISGHSAIPLVYNGDKNYGAIFAGLNNLKKGDKIEVSAGGNYTYEVEGFKIVDPKDLSVVVPPDSEGRYISLMTCVPPGLNFKRLVVLGKMI